MARVSSFSVVPMFRQLNIIGSFRALASTPQRKNTLIALASTRLLVQLSSMPVALTIPSVAHHFNTDVPHAAWMVIIRLLMLGSTVFLAARLGQKYGHVRVYFIGAVIMCIASVLSATAVTLPQLIIYSGVVGFGGALITANSNAIITMVFGSQERGRAFAVPIIGGRMGSVVGLLLFGVFLQYFSWRMVFLSSLPIGLWAIMNSWGLLKFKVEQVADSARGIRIDYFGALLMVGTLAVVTMSVTHLHEGAESFTSPEALRYHVPMHLLGFSLVALFLVIQIRSKNPFMDFRYFKNKYFSMALFSSSTYHLSMLAVTTLVPVVVQQGLGKGPMIVSMVLLPNQLMGLFLPAIAGWIYDRYNPKWLQPGALALIALGIGLLALFATAVPIWGLPMLLLPASIGTQLFNSPNNAAIMNALPQNRSFAAGMLETTTQLGHTVGATIGATAMALALPATIAVMSATDAQPYYRQGFQYAAAAVVWIIITGSVVAIFRKATEKPLASAANPAPQPSGAGDG